MNECSRPASADQRLKELGIQIPAPPAPFGTYMEAVRTGNLLYLSGMLPTEGREAKITGLLIISRTAVLCEDRPLRITLRA